MRLVAPELRAQAIVVAYATGLVSALLAHDLELRIAAACRDYAYDMRRRAAKLADDMALGQCGTDLADAIRQLEV